MNCCRSFHAFTVLMHAFLTSTLHSKRWIVQFVIIHMWVDWIVLLDTSHSYYSPISISLAEAPILSCAYLFQGGAYARPQ